MIVVLGLLLITGGYNEAETQDSQHMQVLPAVRLLRSVGQEQVRLWQASFQVDEDIDVQLVTPASVATPTSIMEDMVLRPSPNTPMPLRSGNIESFDRLLDSVFGWVYSTKAFSVADCEQGYKLSAGIDPYELNRTAIGDAGEVSLWQIHPVHFWKYDKARLQADVEYAAQAAWELSGYGANWTGPWRYCGWQ